MSFANLDLNLEKTKAMLSGIKIPPRPTVISELMKEATLSTPNMNKIANLVSSDPAMSAAVLKIANSAFIGLKTRVVSITLAVLLLGAKNICGISLGIQLNKSISQKSELTKFFWKYSSQMGMISKFIAQKVQYPAEDEAFLFGLFHEAGSIMLSQKFNDYSDRYFEFWRNNNSYFVEKEEKIYGVNHALVGALMAKMWELPEHLVNVIAMHHERKEELMASKIPYEQLRLYAILKFSESIVCIYNNFPDLKEWEEVKDICIETLEIKNNALKLAEECINLLDMEDSNFYN
jgi:HD-like signal output (HDOD) protein